MMAVAVPVKEITNKTIEEMMEMLWILVTDNDWKPSEVKRLEGIIWKRESSPSYSFSYGVAKYGIEATLARTTANGQYTDKDLENMEKKEERQFRRYIMLRADMDMLDYISTIEAIRTNKFYETVWDCLLCDMSLTEIGRHLKKDRKEISNARNEILRIAVQDEMISNYLLHGIVDKKKYSKAIEAFGHSKVANAK